MLSVMMRDDARAARVCLVGVGSGDLGLFMFCVY